jgi:NADH-quinone oxidoreductase subunit M
MFQRVNYGPVTHEENERLPDMTFRERCTLWPAVVMTIVMGLAPMLFLKPMEPSVRRVVELVHRNQGQTARNMVGVRDSGFAARPAAMRQTRSPIAGPQPRVADPQSRIPTPGSR